jgi:hypothetical protein
MSMEIKNGGYTSSVDGIAVPKPAWALTGRKLTPAEIKMATDRYQLVQIRDRFQADAAKRNERERLIELCRDNGVRLARLEREEARRKAATQGYRYVVLRGISDDEYQIGRAVVATAARDLGIAPPYVQWFRPATTIEAPHFEHSRTLLGRVTDEGIARTLDLRVGQQEMGLVETAAHETMHLWQQERRGFREGDDDEIEAKAYGEDFLRRWLRGDFDD